MEDGSTTSQGEWVKIRFIVDRIHELDCLDQMYQFLQRPDAAGRLSTGVFGFNFEQWLIQECQSRGWVCRDDSSRHLPYDIIVNGFKVQCKSSENERVDIRPARPLVGRASNQRAYRVGDYDVLAMNRRQTGEVYFVPAAALVDEDSEGYMKRTFAWDDYASFLGQWDMLAPGTTTTNTYHIHRQLGLFQSELKGTSGSL